MGIGQALLSRLDSLITRERVRNYSWICVLLGAVALVLNAALGSGSITKSGTVVLPDYLAHWTGGRLVLDGRIGALYDPGVQAQLQQEHLPGITGVSWFVSPPFAVFIYLPLAWLPYGTSALLWTVLSAGLLAASLLLAKPLVHPRRRGDYRVLVLVFTATPAVLELVGAGQDSGIALVVLMLGLRLLLAERNVAAGAVLALGLFKPQLFVFVPLALLLQQRYRALAAFGVGALTLGGLSLPVVGLSSWRAWYDALTSPLYQEAVQVGQAWKMQSISSLLTSLGAPESVAYVVLLIGAVTLVIRGRQVRADTQHLWALTVLTTVVFSPHLLLYDLVLVLPVLPYLYSRLNVRAVRLLAVATVILLASTAVRHAISHTVGSWALLAAPWSALPLLGLWILVLLATAIPDSLERAATTPTPAYRHAFQVRQNPGRQIRWPTLPR